MTIKQRRPENVVSAESLGYLLRLSNSLLQQSLAGAFAKHDLTVVQWIALMRLREDESLIASDLIRTMQHDRGAFSRVLFQLEARGYLQRERSKQDRRVVRLQLTPAGHRKVDELIPLTVECLNQALADFNEPEFVELCSLLTKLIDRLQKSGRVVAIAD